MLTSLRVRDLAIAASLDVELHPGLNVITGETGAGKSLLVDALELLAGARARGELVRAGAAEAVVEAAFDLGVLPATRERLVGMLGDVDDELILRRQVRAEGRSRAFVNGTLATAVQLAELAPGLLDICSQHEHHTLVDPSTHVSYLDEFGKLHVQADAVRAA
ncbi:MAG TPA: AAA family ATPase, partial [Myxococcota bacterium]|nr:AAA family ATPase [Myxococcota bacterium]